MSTLDPSQLPEPIRQRVEAELRPGEGVRWVEQPMPGRLTRRALPIVLFAIPWTAFALFWVWSTAAMTVRETGPGRLFPLFGVPFIAVGLGMLTSPIWVMRAAKRTVYVVTDRRALVIRGGWWNR